MSRSDEVVLFNSLLINHVATAIKQARESADGLLSVTAEQRRVLCEPVLMEIRTDAVSLYLRG